MLDIYRPKCIKYTLESTKRKCYLTVIYWKPQWMLIDQKNITLWWRTSLKRKGWIWEPSPYRNLRKHTFYLGIECISHLSPNNAISRNALLTTYLQAHTFIKYKCTVLIYDYRKCVEYSANAVLYHLHVCHYEIDQSWCDYTHTYSVFNNCQHDRHAGGTRLHWCPRVHILILGPGVNPTTFSTHCYLRKYGSCTYKIVLVNHHT